MSGPRPKWWKFYPKDFWGDHLVQDLKPWTRCAYLALLTWAWDRDATLLDPKRALVTMGFHERDADAIWGDLKHMFTKHPDGKGWVQRRQLDDYLEACDQRQAAIEKSAKGHRARWGKQDA